MTIFSKLTTAYFIISIFLFSCTAKKSSESPVNISVPDTIVVAEKKPVIDSLVLPLTAQVLTLISQKDYSKLASFIHPVQGIRFSPYSYVDTTADIKLTAAEFLKQVSNKKQAKLNWGYYDGSGEPITLTINDYFKKFVYDADFLHAENTSLNKMLGQGNSLNNLQAIYPNCIFTESYFKGFDKQYDGMDWRSLKLVYKKEGDKLYLVAIIHDQWTT